MRKSKIKVVIGLSGGVDSSVAAALLKKKGYDVTGVFLRFWKEKDEKNINQKALFDARKVSRKLKIPLFIKDARKEFRKKVVEYFLKTYQKGLTPNPCIFCNKNIKFKILLETARKMKADYVATGHYARRREIKNLRQRWISLWLKKSKIKN